MGNQLVAIAPSQIFPVEHYLTDYTDLKFDISLGSTRFLKVARAISAEGLVVVKVFAIHDPSLPLQTYKCKLEDIRSRLASAVNCLPFQRMVINERAGVLIREYVKYNLYDRISTRPFLTSIEKRWITFQILYALHQCHKVGVCHGDIKLENIMLTSWNWVLLADFAPFKPTRLPEDNPADYSYYFDTSRRRLCYIAPERFVRGVSTVSDDFPNDSPADELRPEMDVFSAGCSLLEMWNEGHAPFELYQLLQGHNANKHIEKLEDHDLRELLSSMVHRDPKMRLSAEAYLDQQRGKLFPEYFYSFLQSYMLMFSSTPVISPDEKITRLKNDIHNVLSYTFIQSDGLVLIVSLVTSNVRGLHECQSKLDCLELMEILADRSRIFSAEIVLDRILPYVLYLLKDVNDRVRACAVDALTNVLACVEKVPASDVNVFTEYIIPYVAPLATDPSRAVRAALARNIGDLAGVAHNYLVDVQTRHCDVSAGGGVTSDSKVRLKFNYENELQTLHESIEPIVGALLSDPESAVKRTCLARSAIPLCVFFGKKRSNDVIVSHAVTYLNDRDEPELRKTFYEIACGVGALIEARGCRVLQPLLLQGLSDHEEYVCAAAIHAMANLTELVLFDKRQIAELISESRPLLAHPNIWIRQALIRLIQCCAKVLPSLDFQVKVLRHIRCYLSNRPDLLRADSWVIIADALGSEIPRPIFDTVISCKAGSPEAFLESIENRRGANKRRGSSLTPASVTVKNIIERMTANGLTEEMQDKLIAMKSVLIKVGKQRQLILEAKNRRTTTDGVVELSSGGKIKGYVTDFDKSKIDVRRRSETVSCSSSAGSRPDTPIHQTTTVTNVSAAQLANVTNTGNIHERSYVEYRTLNCGTDLTALINKKQDHYLDALKCKEWSEQAALRAPVPPPGWRLRRSLVAHLHEHRSSVTRVAPLGESSNFCTSSLDGSLRIWDCSRMAGGGGSGESGNVSGGSSGVRNIANRSKAHCLFNPEDQEGIIAMTACEGGRSIAAAGVKSGRLRLFSVGDGGGGIRPSSQLLLDDFNDTGNVTDVQCLNDGGGTGAGDVLVYATIRGWIVGWDLRQSGPAFKLKNDIRKGAITSFCLDPNRNWLASGTMNGSIVLWDLRFQLRIGSIDDPRGFRVRRMCPHPTQQARVMVASQGGGGEVTIWNLETREREKVLWSSPDPPFSTPTNQYNTTVFALKPGRVDRTGFLLAGGADFRVRYWNLDEPEKSFIAIPAPNDVEASYASRTIDGTCVVQEIRTSSDSSSSGNASETNKAGPEQAPAEHIDAVTDLALVKTAQCFLISSARNGVVKVWK